MANSLKDYHPDSNDEAVFKIQDILLSTLDKHAPVITKYGKLRPDHIITSPVINQLRKKRRKAERIYRKYPNLDNKIFYLDCIRKVN